MAADFLKKIAMALEKKQNSIFTYPVEKQKKYVGKFPEPKDCIERSYYQYCCQMKLYGEPLHFFLNILALPLSVFYLLRTNKCENADESNTKVTAVFFNDGKPENIVGKSLREKYGEIKAITNDAPCLTKEDRKFLKNIFKRYPFSWLFWLKVILKISQYGGAIKKYTPDVILSCDEFSFTSSAVTEYCRYKNVKRINVMHGEKLYYMRDAFVCYDEYHVWNKYYVELLTALRADDRQFIVEVPESVVITQIPGVDKRYDYTYYLAAESEGILREISRAMDVLKKKGKEISIRPHPRYTDIGLVKELFNGMNIESPKNVSIERSLLQTKAAVSLYSTVLNQAYHSGVDIVIDDISNEEDFKKLVDLQFVMLKVEHKTLSEILGE